jgi:hypothetical protein
LLRYLAVAHYGRGRGEWIEGEYPPHWQQLVHEVSADHRGEMAPILQAAEQGAGAEEIATRLEPLITATARTALVRLYPEAARIFE